jgi:large subunit ribosomal protein L24
VGGERDNMKLQNNPSSKPAKVRGRSESSPPHRVSSSSAKAALSTDMRTKYARNTVRVRTGDSVKLVKGEYRGIEGKVQKVYPKEGRVTVEGITREKIAGGTNPVRISVANLVVTNLNMDDKLRREKLEGAK